MEKVINLKLKSFGSYMKTQKGVFIYTERGFSVFIPNKILKKIGV